MQMKKQGLALKILTGRETYVPHGFQEVLPGFHSSLIQILHMAIAVDSPAFVPAVCLCLCVCEWMYEGAQRQ